MTCPELIDIIHQITRRYRHALLANLSVLAVLSLGSAGVLAWRLYAIGLDREWVVGIPGVLAVAAAATLGWLLRRRWICVDEAAGHLDRTLGLQERLLTAAEFAHRTPPPTLYALLVEDTARHFSTGRVRFPRVLDRPGIILALILLVLLCWPGRGNVPMRLAQLPTTQPPPPPPPPPPEQQQQTADSRQQTQQGQGSPSQPQAAGEQGQEGGQQSQPQGSGSDQQAGQSGRQRSGEQQPSQASTQRAGGDQGRGSDQPEQRSGQPSGRGDHDQADSAQQSAGERQEAGGTREQTAHSGRDQTQSARGEREGDAPQKGSPGDQPSAGEGDQSQSQGKGQRGQAQRLDAATQETNGGGGQGVVSGEVTRAQIQQLLKEVSGELKQLQAQLAAANDEPHPDPGTSTDPELYGAPEPLDRATGRPLPIQLETDTTETTAERPGSGVGKPSGEASSAAPQVEAEEVQLSEQPLEETPAGRQTIPPEYRPIFERLQQQRETR